MIDAYKKEVFLAHRALANDDYDTCFAHLERAHVLVQRLTLRHTYVHGLMLKAGLQQRDWCEVAGQLSRMVGAALFSRVWVPLGNSGRARVSAFKPMPIPDDLKRLLRSNCNG